MYKYKRDMYSYGVRATVRNSWKGTKDYLKSLSVEDRRSMYKCSEYVTLKDIPVYTPTSNGSERPRYPRNEKLDQKISLIRGDITTLEVDAIVNAANKHLLGGSGVDGAIHDAAGNMLKEECASLNGCQTGQSKITGGYCLPAKYVIHTVGPIVFRAVGAEDRARLRACYRSALELAAQNNLRSLAVPCISTGIYSYPRDSAACEALSTVREYLDEHHDKFDRVIFCTFEKKDKEIYDKILPLYFPGASTGSMDRELTSTDEEEKKECASIDEEKKEECASEVKEEKREQCASADKEEKREECASADTEEKREECASADKEEKKEECASTDKEEKIEESTFKGSIDEEQTEA